MNADHLNAQDYRITGGYGEVKLVWYMRIIDMGNDFVQINTWTLPSREEKNKNELFSNITSFHWKKKE